MTINKAGNLQEKDIKIHTWQLPETKTKNEKEKKTGNIQKILNERETETNVLYWDCEKENWAESALLTKGISRTPTII